MTRPTDSGPPLEILVAADLGGAMPGSVGAVDHIRSATDLPALLARSSPRVELEVPDRLRGSGSLQVALSVVELKDFAPRRIVESVTTLAQAHALLEALRAVARREQTAEAAAAQIERAGSDLPGLARQLASCRQALGLAPAAGEAAAADAPASSPDRRAELPTAPPQTSVDRLLELADLPGTADEDRATRQRARSLVSAVARSVARAATVRSSSGPLEAATDELALVVGAQLDAILHHPTLRQLESAWRGLRFLVARTDFRRRPLSLQVLQLPPDRQSAVAALEQALGEDDRERPFEVAAVATSQTTDTASESDWLAELARLGEQSRTPLMASVSSSFAQLPALEATGTGSLTDWELRMAGSAYDRWRSLRAETRARWIAPVANRLLLREPYDGTSSGHAGHVERAEHRDAFLFGDPSWALLSLVAASHARTGWPTEIVGRDGRITELPLRSARRPGGRMAIETPLEHLLSARHATALHRQGIGVLVSAPNTDAALLSAAPTAHSEDAGLCYQLLVSRLVRTIDACRQDLRGAAGIEAVARAVGQAVAEQLSDTGAGSSVEVSVVDDDGPVPRIRVAARAGRGVSGGAVVELDFTAASPTVKVEDQGE